MSARYEEHPSNPYLTLLVQSLQDTGVQVQWFTWKRALLGSYDVFHVHWPESLVTSRGCVKSFVKEMFTFLLILRLRGRRTAVVRTVHNVDAHERMSFINTWLVNRIDRLTEGRIHLTRATVGDEEDQHVVIPHGSYRAWFREPSERIVRTGVSPISLVCFFGQIRPYKGVEELIAACPDKESGVRILILGKPLTREYGEQIEAQSRNRENIDSRLWFVEETQLWRILQDVDLVVLPYRSVSNSGSLLLALSAGAPVLIRDCAVGRELQREVGDEWIKRYWGKLEATDILEGVAWARRAEGLPHFSGRSWNEIGRRHADFYRLCSKT